MKRKKQKSIKYLKYFLFSIPIILILYLFTPIILFVFLPYNLMSGNIIQFEGEITSYEDSFSKGHSHVSETLGIDRRKIDISRPGFLVFETCGKVDTYEIGDKVKVRARKDEIADYGYSICGSHSQYRSFLYVKKID